MDIGLSLQQASVPHVKASSTGPAPLQPIPGILDATNVVILGASIFQGAFGTGGPVTPALQAYATAAGFTGSLHSYAVSGHKVVDTIGQHVLAQADLIADQGSNLYITHTGGNNVSSDRPHPGGEGTFQTDYTTLMNAITATDTVVPLPLTKRLYGIDDPAYPNVTNAVVQGDAASEANGSKPYNDAIILPAIAAHAPDWLDVGGGAYADPYDFVERDPGVLISDGIHGGGFALASYALSQVAGRAMGKQESDSRAGKSLIFNISKDNTNLSSIGLVNQIKGYANSDPDKIFVYGAVATDGSFDPFIKTRISGYQNSSSGMGTGAYPRLADTRFHNPEILGSGIYVQGANVFTLSFEHLTPGDVVTVSCCGVRTAGGTNRRGDIRLNGGEVLVLDASNAAPSNQAVFTPITVPADGTLTLELSVTSGSTYAYLHGIILDFTQ